MSLFRSLLLSAFASMWCITLLACRMEWSQNGAFRFMVWNLFLAAIPLGFSTLLSLSRRWRTGTPLIAGWLLFFPNAPYVLTDLIHLRQRPDMPLWFDLLMLLSFALVSLWMGFLSLQAVQTWIARRSTPWLAWGFVSVSLFLSGFGIYLGRFLRWNSWDIVTRPMTLLSDIWVRFADPLAHGRTWGVTLGFGGLLFIGYLLWLLTSTQRPRDHAD